MPKLTKKQVADLMRMSQFSFNPVSKKLYKKLGIKPGEELPSFAWPGGYPLFYVTDHSDVLCPKCANKFDEYADTIVEADVNWENPDMYCDDCGKTIESAYAEDE